MALFTHVEGEVTTQFDNQTKAAAEESIFEAFRALLVTKIAEMSRQLEQENEDLLSAEIGSLNNEIVRELISNTDSTKMPLPMNQTDLDSKLTKESKRSINLYRDTLSEFADSDTFAEGLSDLRMKLEKESNNRRQENKKAFAREVEGPLKTAKQIILLSEDKYSTQFSMVKFIRDVCLLNLNEGKTKHWSADLKDWVIDDFMNSDDQLGRIVRSKEGLWSTIVGFFQWLTFIITSLFS